MFIYVDNDNFFNINQVICVVKNKDDDKYTINLTNNHSFTTDRKGFENFGRLLLKDNMIMGDNE